MTDRTFQRHPLIEALLTTSEDDRLTDLDELTQSMSEFGWIKYFPAVIDENGFVIDGMRRIKVADTIGETPIVKQIRFGSGDNGDIKRVGLFIGGNIGFQRMGSNSRARIQIYLTRDTSMPCHSGPPLGWNPTEAAKERDARRCVKSWTRPAGTGTLGRSGARCTSDLNSCEGTERDAITERP
jgi:hypothetical protein